MEPQATPVWQQLVTWLLFWPLLCLIARQAPYFSGPARDSLQYTQGLASGPDYHASLYLTLGLQACFLAAASKAIWATLKANPLILSGIGLILVSAFWSGSPGNTLRMWVEVTLCTCFACYLVVRMSSERLMNLLMFMGVAASALSIFFVLALPEYGVFAGYKGGAWQGIAAHKNTLGVSMAYLLTPVFFAPQYSRLRRIAYASLILFVILMSQSRGAWLYTLGIAFWVGWLYLMRRLRKHEARLLIALMSVAAILAAITIISSFDKLALMLGKDASMSGRTGLYQEVWRSIMKEPFLGYGYGGFWGSPEAARVGLDSGYIHLGYSENGVLELWLNLGATGVALVLLMIGRAIVQGIRLLPSRFYSPRLGWFLTILILAALSNIDAGWLLVTGTLDWVLILVACIGLEAETRRVRAINDIYLSSFRELGAE